LKQVNSETKSTLFGEARSSSVQRTSAGGDACFIAKPVCVIYDDDDEHKQLGKYLEKNILNYNNTQMKVVISTSNNKLREHYHC
jgi:hypothetical protein